MAEFATIPTKGDNFSASWLAGEFEWEAWFGSSRYIGDSVRPMGLLLILLCADCSEALLFAICSTRNQSTLFPKMGAKAVWSYRLCDAGLF